jgi:hypothetical protein
MAHTYFQGLRWRSAGAITAADAENDVPLNITDHFLAQLLTFYNSTAILHGSAAQALTNAVGVTCVSCRMQSPLRSSLFNTTVQITHALFPFTLLGNDYSFLRSWA